jgi:hypothetical protein
MAALPSSAKTTTEAWSPAHEVEQRIWTEILQSGRTQTTASASQGLHVCPSCAGAFVVPGDECDVVGERLCRIELYCVDCGWEETAVYSDDELEALDRELDRGYADMLWALEVLWIGNEEQAIERFAAALAVGAILPEDF